MAAAAAAAVVGALQFLQLVACRTRQDQCNKISDLVACGRRQILGAAAWVMSLDECCWHDTNICVAIEWQFDAAGNGRQVWCTILERVNNTSSIRHLVCCRHSPRSQSSTNELPLEEAHMDAAGVAAQHGAGTVSGRTL